MHRHFFGIITFLVNALFSFHANATCSISTNETVTVDNLIYPVNFTQSQFDYTNFIQNYYPPGTTSFTMEEWVKFSASSITKSKSLFFKLNCLEFSLTPIDMVFSSTDQFITAFLQVH